MYRPHNISSYHIIYFFIVTFMLTFSSNKINKIWLVVSTPLKNMSSSMGFRIIPFIIDGIKAMFETTNQKYIQHTSPQCLPRQRGPGELIFSMAIR